MEPLLMETEYEKPLVLVVDDDPTNLRILVSKLNREYRLGVAKSGTKALEYMGKQIPDLVLLDVMMPDMDGYAVCEHIKRDPRLCDIPVVFISYVDDPSQKTRGFEVGGVDYITKPFHDAEVLARVRTHIMNKQMREQLKRHNAEIGKSWTSTAASCWPCSTTCPASPTGKPSSEASLTPAARSASSATACSA